MDMAAEDPIMPDPAEPEDPAGFVALLRRLHVEAGRPSYRQLEARSQRTAPPGDRQVWLSRSGMSEVLTGKRVPSRQFVAAFVTACGVGPAELPAWLRAWERVMQRTMDSRASESAKSVAVLQSEYDALKQDVSAALRSMRDRTGELWNSGHRESAALLWEDLTAQHVRLLGPDHPDTLAARGTMARWRGETGDAPAAAAAYEELLADRVRLSGRDDPDTLATREELARWCRAAGDRAGAAAAYEELLADQVRLLGRDHPDTLITRSELARLWDALGVGGARRMPWRRR